MLQIVIKSPNEGDIQPVVWNYDEVKSGVAEMLSQYKGRAYTPDAIRGARVDRAALNKLRDAVAGARRSKKKEYLAPFETFEVQCKEIEGMISETSAAIDSQIKAYEAEEAAQKREIIATYYDSVVAHLRDYMPLEKIWSDRWLNKTYPMKAIQQEIDRILEIVTADLHTIRQTCGVDSEACISEYLDTQRNLNKALEKHRQLEDIRSREQQARLAALKAKLQAQDAAKAKAEEFPARQPAAPQEAPQAAAAPDQAAPAETLALKHIDFRVWYYDKADLQALREFLVARGLRYGRVPTVTQPNI